MSFNPNIPQPTDRPSDSQAQLLTNNQQLDTIFDVDHVTFSAAAGKGEHDKITFNNVLGADPGLAAPKSSLYTKNVSGVAQLFFQNASVVRQLSNLTITTVGSNRGFVTPWGIILNWGTATLNVAATLVTFAVPFSNPHSLQLTAQANNGARNASYQNFIGASFTGYATNNGLIVSYFAIGN